MNIVNVKYYIATEGMSVTEFLEIKNLLILKLSTKEYSYLSDIQLSPGDIIVAPVRDSTKMAKVISLTDLTELNPLYKFRLKHIVTGRFVKAPQ